MTDNVFIIDRLRDLGWRLVEDGQTRAFDKDGLTLSYDGHWSVRQYFVSSATGGWGNLQEIMLKCGISPETDDRDFLQAAIKSEVIRAYLDSVQWQQDRKSARHGGMERLREFQRSIGIKESWLDGEEDDARRQSEQASQARSPVALKYWLAAVASAIAMVAIIARSEDPSITITAIAAGLAILGGGLASLKLSRRI